MSEATERKSLAQASPRRGRASSAPAEPIALEQEGMSLIGWASERTERELCAFFGRKGGLHLTPKLHLTLFAHAGGWPKGLREKDIMAAAPSCVEAQLAGLQLWRRPQMEGGRWTLFAHDFLVAPLISPEAERAHAKLTDLGLEHCYGPFLAHLTLARSNQTLRLSEQFLEEYGRFIARQKLVATFDRWEVRPMQTPPRLKAAPIAGFPAIQTPHAAAESPAIQIALGSPHSSIERLAAKAQGVELRQEIVAEKRDSVALAAKP